MKHTLAFIAALAMTGAAYAAGPIWLNNYDSNNPIYYMDQSTVLASGFVTITANGAAFQNSSDIPVADGFFDNGFGATGADDGATVTFSATAWKDAATKDKEFGTATWTAKVGTTPAAPAAPVPGDLLFPKGLTVKAGGPVETPEPSVIALALLGGAALLLRRRS
jgi:hypothetical protein